MILITHHKSICMWYAKALSVTSWLSIRFKFNLPTKIPKFNGFTFFVYQTRLQASTLSFPELISKLPQIGLQGLYRGSIPAILGQFSRSVLFNWFICKILCRLQNSNPVICSHGLRTGIFEASKLVLINVAPTLPEIQVRFTTPVLVQTLYSL